VPVKRLKLYKPSLNHTVCLVLRHLREDRALTQTQVAIRLGRQQAYVSNYETLKRDLSVGEFIEICQVLDMMPSVIVADLE
jgi:transcriptional regulator with XRE-family HTH domain